MKTFSRTNIKRQKKRDRRNVFRALFICLILILLNVVVFVFIDNPKTLLPVFLGVIFPVIYSIFYFISKRLKYRFKIQTNSAILFPVLYSLVGLIWYAIVAAYFGLSSIKIESKPNKNSKNFKASIQSTPSNDITHTIDKNHIKTAFIAEDFLIKAVNIPFYMVRYKCRNRGEVNKNKCEGFASSSTNKTIKIFLLFISQSIIILISEKILYPLYKKKFKSVNHKTEAL